MGIYPPPKLGQLRRRDVPEGLISDMRGVSARCLFLPLADIGCGTFISTRPSGLHLTFESGGGLEQIIPHSDLGVKPTDNHPLNG